MLSKRQSCACTGGLDMTATALQADGLCNTALERDPRFAPFVFGKARKTGEMLGEGSYGCVERLEINGIICAGKNFAKTIETLTDTVIVGDDDTDISEKSYNFYRSLSYLHHPNIVHFLGICFLDDCKCPVLVMECLQYNLDDVLNSRLIHPTMRCSILQDVARGLVYLHSRNPPLIHRDLTAKNVLLAKIADTGNSHLLSLRYLQSTREA